MAVSDPCYEYLIYGPNVIGAAIPDDSNAIIPLTGKHKLNSNVIYSEDGVTPIYTEYTLELEAVIALEYTTSNSTNLEFEVERLRNILTTPGLQIKCNNVGLGQTPIVSGSSFAIPGTYDNIDAKGGPFPRRVSVEPIASNNAILIQWELQFYIEYSDCALTGSKLIDYSVEQDSEIDDDGNINYVVNATLKVADPAQLTNSMVERVTDILNVQSGRSFQGMTKKKSFQRSRDGRTLKIKLTYKEVPSDNAFFPFTRNVELTDNLKSSLLGSGPIGGDTAGFYQWARTLSGTVNLPPRVHQAYAWAVVVQIIRERILKLHPNSKLAPKLDMNSGQVINESEQKKHYHLPIEISITTRPYSRSLSFDIKFYVVSDLENLLDNTKFFQRINTSWSGIPYRTPPKQLSEQWEEWQRGKDKQNNGYFSYLVSGLPITFNQCLDISNSSDHELASDRLAPYEDDPDYLVGEDPKGELDQNITLSGNLKSQNPSQPSPSETDNPADDQTESAGYVGDNEIDKGLGGGGPQTDTQTQVYNAAYPEDGVEHIDPNSGLTVGGIDHKEDLSTSWIDYKHNLEYIEDPNQVAVAYLEEPPTNYYKSLSTGEEPTADPAYSNRSRDGLYINGRTSNLSEQTNPQDAIARGHSRWYIRSTGMATRVNHKIPAPFLENVNGQELTRVSCRINHSQIASGDVPVYMLLWDITYVVTGQDIHGTGSPEATEIVGNTTGTSAPGAYT